MSYDVIETGRYLIRLHKNESYLEYMIKDGVTIDEGLILETKSLIESRRPGERFYILAEGAGFFNITNEARKLSASPEFSGHMAAVAFHTTNETLTFLGNIYNKINKPVTLTKIFSNRESAHSWLSEQMTAEGPQD